MCSIAKRPRFSIITVTYQAEAVLERTLQSVACQTYPYVDVHIIDGASQDGTLPICQKYASIITTVKSEPDKGLYDAMNKGLQSVKGDYLCFLNAGDQLQNPHTLQDLADSIESQGHDWPDVVYGETEIVDDNNNFVRMRRLSAPEQLSWRSFLNGMLVCHQAFWVRTAIAVQEEYDLSYRFSADFDWCIRVMKRSSVLHNTHLTLVRYLQGGMSVQHHRASLLERLDIMAKHYGWCRTVLQHAWFVLRAIIKK